MAEVPQTLEKITWTNGRRKLSELIPWPINPATIGRDEARRLEESLEEFGQVQTIAISPSNEIYDGHQRQVVWGASQKFGMDFEVDVRISSRELTERERKKLVIFLRKGTVGEFDWDLLANNWSIPELLEWGFKGYELGLVGNPDDPNLLWQGMPAFEQEAKEGIIISVHFKNETDQNEFFTRLGIKPDIRNKSFWFPERPEDRSNQMNKGLVYSSEP